MSKPLPELESGLVRIERVSEGPAKRRIEDLGFFPGAVVEAEQLGGGAVALSGKLQPKTVLGAEASWMVSASQLSSRAETKKKELPSFLAFISRIFR